MVSGNVGCGRNWFNNLAASFELVVNHIPFSTLRNFETSQRPSSCRIFIVVVLLQLASPLLHFIGVERYRLPLAWHTYTFASKKKYHDLKLVAACQSLFQSLHMKNMALIAMLQL